MNLLFDSHVFLWQLFTPVHIGSQTRRAIDQSATNQVSSVSIWELALKHGKGKLPHPPSELADGIAALHLTELPVLSRHIVKLDQVELPHRDPFDALLVAQSMAVDAVLVTADRTLLASPHATMDATH